MSYLLKFAMLVTLDPPAVERADLRIAGGRIVERAPRLDAPAGDEEVIDLKGKLVMPGMVCAHTHLYSTFARGMPAPPRTPSNFKEILELIWWRLDRSLDEDTIYWSAMAGAMDAVRAGTTCVFDHHASPSHVTGSLQIVREAIEKVGLRAVLCYEVTDRGGQAKRDQGLEENRSFLEWASSTRSPSSDASSGNPSLFRAMVGAHASFTLSDESVDRCAGLMREFNAGLHIHVAEDKCDVEDARSRYESGIVERLARHDALSRRTILAHGIHLSDEDIDLAKSAGVWFAHNPRSNMNNQVGYAPVAKFGERIVLGTDGIGADMFEEARFAFFKARDATGQASVAASPPSEEQATEDMRAGRPGTQVLGADDWLRVLANNQRLASEAFGLDSAALNAGSSADLIVLDYQSPTPLTAENLAWHFTFGINSASVESVMVNGRFVIRDRLHPLGDICAESRKASEKLWSKLREL